MLHIALSSYHAPMLIARRPPPWPGLVALFVMCSLIVALGLWMFLPDLVKGMALRLAPPAYPGGQFVDLVERLEYGTATEETIYRVSAHVSTVRPWMERRMPGFNTCAAFTPINPNCSANIVCEKSFIGKALIWLMLGENGRRSETCVSVMILPLPGDDRYTLIRYSMSWPAPMDVTQ